jgi:WD40 repeat protein
VVVSGDYQGLLRFWNPVAGSNTRPEVLWKDEVISSIAFNPAFDRMITSTMGRQIQIWDTAHMRRLLLLGGHTKAVLGARFTPDGTRILSVSMDGTLRMWDSRPREAMKRR